ncbi:MAG: SDR family oxidoreductase [Anaerolineae bacterium]|nr:MAG: SDR family oxidoreductase [Anaerolineae bacterium]
MNSSTVSIALITGASRGLGLTLARALGGRGWHLLMDGRNGEALEAARRELAEGTTVRAVRGSVAEPQHRYALLQAAREMGGLDLVVNNASILGLSPRPSLLNYPLAILEEVFLVNTLAPLGVLQAVQSALRPGARVINITSDAGAEAYAGWGGYGASKAALEHMSAVLAEEAPEMRVYWVDPGDMNTDMQQEAFPGEDISDRLPPEDSVPGLLALIEKDYPSGRYHAHDLPEPQRASAAL